ncbi:MAG TPA: hypothetical protein VHD91_10695 [Gaiellaceae bacterium]|nr:hypothetical protein [Gaiellaceae bacterium]
MPEYLTERYEPGAAAETLQADAVRLADAVAALRLDGAAIEFLGSTFLPEDDGVFSRFASDSEELVAEVHQRASVPFERIIETRELRGER